MAEQQARRNAPPLEPVAPLQLAPPTARFTLRGDNEVMSAAAGVLGLSGAPQTCRSAQSGERAALWLGPDEQLLLAPLQDAAPLTQQLTAALAGKRHALVDVSHRQLALQLAGAQAAAVLNVGCPLDLDLAAFPVGMCTRTVLGKADIVLWRTAAQSFHLEVWRSFADYLVTFLNEAAREFAF